jgi:hypothetical protein
VSCLESLTLVTYPKCDPRTGLAEWGRNFPITTLLGDTSLRETLIDLTIGVTMPRTRSADWLDFYNAKIWKDLDPVLSLITSLRRTLIHVDPGCRENIPAHVRTGIGSSMPLMEQPGILIFKCEGDVSPERGMWTDRG